jgi:hypothetical protein
MFAKEDLNRLRRCATCALSKNIEGMKVQIGHFKSCLLTYCPPLAVSELGKAAFLSFEK